MRTILACLLALILLPAASIAGPVHLQFPPIIVEESDGSPSVKGVWKLKVTNGTLTQSGSTATLDLSGAGGGVGFSLADPNADRIYFWDDGAGANAFLAPGDSIAITGTTLDTIQDIRTTASPTLANLGLSAGGALRSATSAGNTLLLQAYDVDGAGYTTFATLTANNTPTMDLATGVTIGAAYIYRAAGTDIPLADGGTNASLTASNGGIFYSTDTAGAILAGTATAGQLLQSGATAAPTWSTATYPATAAGTGTILRADGTNWIATTATYPTTTTVNQLLYSSSDSVVAGLATAASGLLVTSGAGVPSIGTDIPTAVTIGGQYVYRVGGTDVAIADGGTGVGSWTDGQLLIGNTTGNTAALATLTGTANQITVTNGASTITLATPQNIATASTPQFARLGLGAAADATNVFSATSASTTDLSKSLNVAHTGAITGTGYGGYFSKTGASTTNIGLYAAASGATNNYAAIFESGNVGIGTITFGTNAVTVLALGAGTAPTTSPADITQLWTEDWNGAGTNALFIRTEEGTQHVFGSNVGIGTTGPTAKLHVAGDVSLNKGAGLYVGSAGGGTGENVELSWVLNVADWQAYDRTNSAYRRQQYTSLDYLWRVNGATNGMALTSTGFVGLGTPSPDRLLHPELANATTATVDYAQRLSHIVSTASTGSSDGFGVGLEFELETGTDLTNQISGTIESLWATAANDTRKGRLNLYAYDTAARLGLTVEASGAAAMLGFFGVGAVVRPTALTAQLTSITHTSPGTPDYALQDLVQNTGFGFVTADEGNTLLSVVLNLQTRLAEVEQKLEDLGLLTP